MFAPRPSRFFHDPLDLTKASIRVLGIQTGAESTQIECVVRHVPLRRSHTCLSYMWGDESNNQTILLNGRSFSVRYTLWTFLQRARAYGYRADFWIDAVCIDQANLQERNHQVRQMARIYRQARYVIIWLGQIDGHLLKSVLKVSKAIRVTGRVYEHFDHTDGSLADSALFRSPTLHRGISTLIGDRWQPAMRQIMTSPYWQRVWITQEILLSRDAQIFLGSTTVMLEDVAHFAMACRLWSPNSFEDRRFRQGKVILNMLSFTSDWHAMRQLPPYPTWDKSNSFQSLCRMKYFEQHPRRRLKYLLRQAQLSECFDGRDRIYGIMGLSDRLTDMSVSYDIDDPCLALNVVTQIMPWKVEHVMDLARRLETTLRVGIDFICGCHQNGDVYERRHAGKQYISVVIMTANEG